jgi:hypothetical protein
MHAEELCIKNAYIQILVRALKLGRRTSILIPMKTLIEDLSLLGCDAVSSGDYKTLYLPAWLLYVNLPNDKITSLKSSIFSNSTVRNPKLTYRTYSLYRINVMRPFGH